MSLTANSFTTFATTPLEAGASGQEFVAKVFIKELKGKR